MEKKTFYLTCERTWVYDTLIFAAGILGSYTYMLCGGIFCNAQTGNIVLLGIALGTRSWLKALYYVIPISAYTLGAFISELIPDDVKHRFHIRWETILVAVEIVFVAILGALPEATPVQVFQVSINFIASMQYNTFRNSEGVPMATTFATNHVRQLGIGLARELHRRHGDTSHRRILRRHFSMIPLFRYRFTIWITLSSFTFLRRMLMSNSWFSVSKYLDRSRTTALVYPCSAYSLIFRMASFALRPGR